MELVQILCLELYDNFRQNLYYGVDTLLADEAEMFFSQDFAAHDMAQNKETTTRTLRTIAIT